VRKRRAISATTESVRGPKQEGPEDDGRGMQKLNLGKLCQFCSKKESNADRRNVGIKKKYRAVLGLLSEACGPGNNSVGKDARDHLSEKGRPLASKDGGRKKETISRK